MRKIHGLRRCLAIATLAAASLATSSASAFEVHNYAGSFGSFTELRGIGVDQANGNVYAADEAGEAVKVFGGEGGSPAGGGPSSFTGAATHEGSFQPRRVAVDPASGDIYVVDNHYSVVDEYRVNGSQEYEYVCEFHAYAATGKSCLPASGAKFGNMTGQGGVAVDSAGDVYLEGGPDNSDPADIYEFNAEGEAVQAFPQSSEFYDLGLAVAANGTIYALAYLPATEYSEVIELKRSSLTGAVEGQPRVVPHTLGSFHSEEGAKGIAEDRATGQLFVTFGNSAEALDEAGEVVSRFGVGVIEEASGIAVDEASGEVYVGSELRQNIDRFGPGISIALPTVDTPPPAVTDVGRTSAEISPTIDSENATTVWQLEYVRASEYQPAAKSPYANGGSTPQTQLAPGAVGVDVGPLAITGLLAGTVYDYRIVATNELGTVDGPDYTFTTAPATPPLVATNPASEVTQTGVLLSGTVNTEELQTSYEFEVGLDTSYGGAKLFGNAGNSGVEAVSASLQFLIPGTTYHYRLVATNEDGTTYGQDMTFTTPGVPAIIAQPVALPFVPNPSVVFPSVAGAQTKGATKTSKKKKKKRKHKAKHGKHKTHAKKQAHGRKGKG